MLSLTVLLTFKTKKSRRVAELIARGVSGPYQKAILNVECVKTR